PRRSCPPGREVPMENELAPSAPLVDVKAGKVSRDLYALDPEKALNFGFALYRLTLARKAAENARTKGRLTVEELLRLNDMQFARYAQRAKLILAEGLLDVAESELEHEGVSLEPHD